MNQEFYVPYFIYFNIKDTVIFKFGGKLTLFIICYISPLHVFLATILNLFSFLMLGCVSFVLISACLVGLFVN